MSKETGNIQAVNAWWSVGPEEQRTWHAKFEGTEKEFPRGTVLWVDRYTKKTGETELKEVIVVDYRSADFTEKMETFYQKAKELNK